MMVHCLGTRENIYASRYLLMRLSVSENLGYWRKFMKKNIWLLLGIIGVLLGNPSADTYAKAKVKISIAIGQKTSRHHHNSHWHRRYRHHDHGRRYR